MTLRGNWIGGEWRQSWSARTRERRNPADHRELVAVSPDSNADDVRAAVDAVAESCHEWAETAPEQRGAVLQRAADRLEAGARQLAEELVREEGKTLPEAVNETQRTAANLRFYAAEALRLSGEALTVSGSGLVFTRREPVGVVAAITPWNFPLSIPSRKLGPALAAGNGVVFKPSEFTPLMGQRLVEALLDAGLPAGVIALVHGGAEAGAALVADPRVAAVTFTGSYGAGEAIHRAVAPYQRTQLEMGGKNPVVVLDDADLPRAADLIVQGAFGLSGQACTGTSRVIAHEKIHDELLDLVVTRTESRRVGNGLGEGVQMGPLATSAQLSKARDYLAGALTEGADLRTGGDPLPDGLAELGHFMRPAVLAEVKPTSRVAREEVFGPVLAFLRVSSFDEAIRVANDTEYGLSAGLVTRDLGTALEFARRVDSGLVKINQPTTGMAINAPFGGVKRSSTQTFKEQSGDTMMRFYTVDKTVYLGP